MENNLNYIARCKSCGRLVGVVSGDCPAKDQAKEVAAWIRQGYEVEKLATEDVRKAEWRCKCPSPEKKKKQSNQRALV